MPTTPLVSVLLPVYNGHPYLRDAVQSILDQTFENFEFIIINDGSTDGSEAVLERFADRDDRIRLIHQKNRGLVPSLNRGLSMAKGRYIARMDADDISLPERLGQQVRFLKANPKIGVVGTQHVWIGADGEVTHRPSLPTDPSFIAWRLLFVTCIVHPSILARRSLIRRMGGYAAWAEYGEDYELWTRAVLKSQIANLPQILLKYRRWDGEQATKSKREVIDQTVCRSAATLHRALLGSSADDDIAHFLARMPRYGVEEAVQRTGLTDFQRVFEYIQLLYGAYKRRLLVDQSNIQARQAALVKLDTMAEKVAEERGWLMGIKLKLRGRLMSPIHEVIPWILAAIRRRTR
mgnify:CR=1 FL=1